MPASWVPLRRSTAVWLAGAAVLLAAQVANFRLNDVGGALICSLVGAGPAALLVAVVAHACLRARAPAAGLPAEPWPRTVAIPSAVVGVTMVVTIVVGGLVAGAQSQPIVLAAAVTGLAYVAAAAAIRGLLFQCLSDANLRKTALRGLCTVALILALLPAALPVGGDLVFYVVIRLLPVLLPVALPAVLACAVLTVQGWWRHRVVRRLGPGLEADGSEAATTAVSALQEAAAEIPTSPQRAAEGIASARVAAAFVSDWRSRGRLELAVADLRRKLPRAGRNKRERGSRHWTSLVLSGTAWVWGFLSAGTNGLPGWLALLFALAALLAGARRLVRILRNPPEPGVWRVLLGMAMALPLSVVMFIVLSGQGAAK